MTPGYGGGQPGGAYGGGGPAGPGGYAPDGSGGNPGEGGGQIQQFEKGTAEYAVQQLVLKMSAGDTTGLDELISEKTNDDLLAPLRDGEADAALIQQGKELAAGAQLLNIRDSGGSKLFMVRNGAGQMLTITAKREGADYRVSAIKVDTPRGRRR